MILKIGFRNIFRQKRRTFLTISTMFGGFVLSAFTIGWSDGTYNNIINMFTRNQLGHIQIHKQGYLDRPSLYKTIDNYNNIGREIGNIPGVVAWSPRIYSAALASLNEKTTGVRIIGIDPELEQNSTRFNNKIIEGKSFSKLANGETILGIGLAKILKAGLGNEVVIISQGADGSIANDLYHVIGIAESGNEINDQTGFHLHIKDAEELLVLYGRIHEIVIIGEELSKVRELAVAVDSTLNNPELDVAPWQVFAKDFYYAMKSDQEGGWIMIFVIVLIIAIGVLNTVLMTVLERRREYGVLKSIGMQPFQVFKLIISEVAVMTMISLVIGCALSFFVNYFFSAYGIPMPITFTYGGVEFSRGYSEINAHSFYIPALAVAISAMLVSIFPAVKAARIEPARAMRIH